MKSEVRIYHEMGGYSSHAAHLYITINLEGDAMLHVLVAKEDIWIPLRDVADLMAEAKDELPGL